MRHDIVEQFLANGVVDQVFTLTLRPDGAATREADPAGMLRGGLDDLRRVVETDDVVFVDGLGVMPRASRLRHLLRLKMPVIGILYSLPGASQTGFYHWLQAELRPQDTIVAISSAGYDALDSIFRHTSRHSRYAMPDIVRIPLAVDAGAFRLAPDAPSRRALGWPDDKVVLVTIGRFTDSSKADLEPLLWAIRELSTRESVHLVCAGADSQGYAASVQACATAYGVAGQVSILTNFSPALKPTILAAADVFVSVADNVQETFGIALLEAMASGLPVVASDWSGYRDLVVDGETGFLVETRWSRATAAAAEIVWTTNVEDEPAIHMLARGTTVSRGQLCSGLSNLVTQPDLRRQFGAAAHKRVSAMFGWRSLTEQYKALIERKLSYSWKAAAESVPRIHEVFASYATGNLPSQLRLRLKHPLQSSPKWLSEHVLGPPDLRAGIEALLAKFEAGVTVDVIDSEDFGDDRQPIAAAWLLKKGVCQLEGDCDDEAATQLRIHRE